MTVALVAFILLLLTHPRPEIPLFDTVYLAERLETLTLREAWIFMTSYHTYARPVRTVELWGAAHLWGTSAMGYGLANLAGVAILLGAAASVVTTLTDSRGRGVAVAALTGLAYPTLYAVLHFPFALNAALAFTGLALVLEGWTAGAVLLILGGLGHEVFLLLALVPVLGELVALPAIPLRRRTILAPLMGLPLWWMVR